MMKKILVIAGCSQKKSLNPACAIDLNTHMGEDYSDVTNKDFEKCTELLYKPYEENK